jgi:mRNA interferase MazF
VIGRGSICWVDLGAPRGSRAAKTRPVLVVQDDAVNASRNATTVVAVITSNTGLAAVGGNVFISASASGLAKDSVINVSRLLTVNKTDLDDPIGRLPDYLMAEVDEGLRLVLGI